MIIMTELRQIENKESLNELQLGKFDFVKSLI